MDMKIGFAWEDITPPLGIELGGYAGYRPNRGVHDPLHCKAILLEQGEVRFALVALDLLCVDEPLYRHIAEAVAELGVAQERLIVTAIHSHASPLGVFPGEGILGELNCTDVKDREAFRNYQNAVVGAAKAAIQAAAENLEPFRVRTARGPVPAVGSERHTGEPAKGSLTVLHFRTGSGKNLMVYSFPCHPTVLGSENLLVSADFTAGIQEQLDADMGVFLNSAAGDISTRFTRREATFAECRRMGSIAAQAIAGCIEDARFHDPEPLRGMHSKILVKTREVETEGEALGRLLDATILWQEAITEGAAPDRERLLRSQVEGAGVNLEFARALGSIRELELPVTVFRFMGISFGSIPGELFSTLLGEDMVAICYANGYYRYIADRNAYDNGYYEALAAVLARGEGEYLMEQVRKLLQELN